MKQSRFRVVDAVMGTGKSTWLAKTILKDNKRTVIVLPRISELERYEDLLQTMDGLVSLAGDRGTGSKKERFREALSDAQVILITHALFEKHLTLNTFDIIREGEWTLVMDEVVSIFEPIKSVTGTDIDGLLAKDVMRKVMVTELVAKLEVNPEKLHWYLNLPASEASQAQKGMIKEALIKDVLAIEDNDNDSRGFPTFSLNERRLNAFKDITVLTYPFKDTDLDYWLQIKGYAVEHLKLTREASTDSLSDFKLLKHDGKYSGKEYVDRIELVGITQRGKKSLYGEKANHFSVKESKRHFKVTTGKASIETDSPLDQVRKTLRREFRNKKDKSRLIESDNFMFTCPKDTVSVWKDSRNGLPGAFIGATSWVPFNERAVNGHAHKHNLAFLHNVFPFAEVQRTVEAFGIRYDRDRYALFTIIQWIWRSAIREGEKIRVYLPSNRMRDILNAWLNAPME